MRRNLKVLGLALVAVFAISAVAASAALAEATFTTGSDETVITGETTTQGVFREGGLEVACKPGFASGVGGTTQTFATVEPIYAGCTIVISGLGELEAQVDTNGCHYTFTASGTLNLTCSTEHDMEVTVFILGKFRKCMDVASQSGLTVDYANETETTGGKNVWDVKVKSTAKNIVYSKTGSCGSGTFTNAEYLGELTVWGEDTVGNPVDVTWDA